MGMQQRLEARQQSAFVIQATSHCRSGKLPRWSFLIQGVGGNSRQGMVGTDAHGHGLYLYASPTGDLSVRTQLIAAAMLSLPDSLNRQQANDEVMKLLGRVNWNDVQIAARPRPSRFELFAVA